jgi:hypothetical protein
MMGERLSFRHSIIPVIQYSWLRIARKALAVRGPGKDSTVTFTLPI